MRLSVSLATLYDYPEHPKTIGEHIRKVRMDRKLSQCQVARILGATAQNLCAWELNRAVPATKSLPKIIRFLGYDPRPVPDTFGQHIVHLRGSHGLSQLALAKLLRVDTLTLRRWETDQHQPTKKLLRKLQQMFPAFQN